MLPSEQWAKWATPEDFATLFQYFWYKDFPIDDQKAIGATRADWTIHIGIVVRNVADLTGLVARFEKGSRKDAILRSRQGDEFAIEWEWDGVDKNELCKLKKHNVLALDPSSAKRDKNSQRPLKCAVLITYAETQQPSGAYDCVSEKWKGARWPLLLVLIDWEKSRKYASHRDFKNLNISVFDLDGKQKPPRIAPAYPWMVQETRWRRMDFAQK